MDRIEELSHGQNVAAELLPAEIFEADPNAQDSEIEKIIAVGKNVILWRKGSSAVTVYNAEGKLIKDQEFGSHLPEGFIDLTEQKISLQDILNNHLLKKCNELGNVRSYVFELKKLLEGNGLTESLALTLSLPQQQALRRLLIKIGGGLIEPGVSTLLEKLTAAGILTHIPGSHAQHCVVYDTRHKCLISWAGEKVTVEQTTVVEIGNEEDPLSWKIYRWESTETQPDGLPSELVETVETLKRERSPTFGTPGISGEIAQYGDPVKHPKTGFSAMVHPDGTLNIHTDERRIAETIHGPFCKKPLAIDKDGNILAIDKEGRLRKIRTNLNHLSSQEDVTKRRHDLALFERAPLDVTAAESTIQPADQREAFAEKIRENQEKILAHYKPLIEVADTPEAISKIDEQLRMLCDRYGKLGMSTEFVEKILRPTRELLFAKERMVVANMVGKTIAAVREQIGDTVEGHDLLVLERCREEIRDAITRASKTRLTSNPELLHWRRSLGQEIKRQWSEQRDRIMEEMMALQGSIIDRIRDINEPETLQNFIEQDTECIEFMKRLEAGRREMGSEGVRAGKQAIQAALQERRAALRQEQADEMRHLESERKSRLAEVDDLIIALDGELHDTVSNALDLERFLTTSGHLRVLRVNIAGISNDIDRREKEDALERIIQHHRTRIEGTDTMRVTADGRYALFGAEQFPIFKEASEASHKIPKVPGEIAISQEVIGSLELLARLGKMQLGLDREGRRVKDAQGMIMLEGDTGTGKDIIIDIFAEQTKRPLFVFDCSKWTQKGEFTYTYEFDGRTIRVDSEVKKALATPGAILYFNEFNQLDQAAQKYLNSLLSHRRKIAAPFNGEEPTKEDVLILGSMNGRRGYHGVEIETSVSSRIRFMEVDYLQEKMSIWDCHDDVQTAAKKLTPTKDLSPEDLALLWNYAINQQVPTEHKSRLAALATPERVSAMAHIKNALREQGKLVQKDWRYHHSEAYAMAKLCREFSSLREDEFKTLWDKMMNGVESPQADELNTPNREKLIKAFKLVIQVVNDIRRQFRKTHSGEDVDPAQEVRFIASIREAVECAKEIDYDSVLFEKGEDLAASALSSVLLPKIPRPQERAYIHTLFGQGISVKVA